jgi:hypothetical protein
MTNIITHKSHWVSKAHKHRNEETVKPFLKQMVYPRVGNPAHVVKTNIWNPDSTKNLALDFLHEQETDHKLEELHPSELHLYGCCNNMPSQQPTCEAKVFLLL